MIDSKRLTRWYDFQAPFYHAWRDKYDSPLIAAVSETLTVFEKPFKVLDIGCGSGFLAIGLGMMHPDWRVTGVDPSIGLLKIARREATRRELSEVRFLEGSVHDLAFPDTEFDAIVAAGVFPNINDHAAALSEMRRVLKLDGILVIVEFNRSTMSRIDKIFFHTMIKGYQVISWVFPQFRFANKWSIETGTIDRAALIEDMKISGFTVQREQNCANHMVITAAHAGA